MKKGYKFEAIGFQTNCYVNVRGPEFGPKQNHEVRTSSVMHVVINPRTNDGKPLQAKQIIEDTIREFVGDDGSKGRLAYELAAANESNRCHGSKSNAVFQWNPFQKSNRKVCMTVVKLTFKAIPHQNGSVEKDFHASYLLQSHVLGHVSNATTCRLWVCGDQHHFTTKLCDPYVLICGESPEKVDRAFGIVMDYVVKHQRACNCEFSK
jgi:hypothetical protein